jgi:hypothetical protein
MLVGVVVLGGSGKEKGDGWEVQGATGSDAGYL